MRIDRREFIRTSGAALAGTIMASPVAGRTAAAAETVATKTSFFLVGDTHYCADEFATTDAWQSGAWTPGQWRFPLRA